MRLREGRRRSGLRRDLAAAILLHRAGRLREAEEAYRSILANRPEDGDVLHLLGLLAVQTGRHQTAIDFLQRAIALRGSVAEDHGALGEAYRAAGKLTEAIDCYRRALSIKPRFAEAHSNMGLALRGLGRTEEAIAAFRLAVAIKRDFAQAHCNLATVLKEQGDLDEAIAHYRLAAASASRSAEVHSNLGVALHEKGELKEAERVLRRALRINPELAAAHYNLGNVLKDLGSLDQAVAAYRRALELASSSVEILANLTVALREVGRLREAVEASGRALSCARATGKGASGADQSVASIRWNRSLCLLQLGEYREGFEAYEARRFLRGRPIAPLPAPLWDGCPLDGETILLLAEQGFGDTFLAARYLPLVKQRGGRIVLQCRPETLRLFSGFDGVDELLPVSESAPAVERCCPMMSLPGLFGTTADTIPPPARFTPPPAARAKAAELVPTRDDLTSIGIVWSGDTTFADSKRRAAPLAQFLRLMEVPRCHWFSLQKGSGEADLEAAGAGAPIIPLGPLLDDFADTAAVLERLDLIIMTDSSVAHLAGCMDRPVWNLVQLVPYWIYMMDGETTPWYPSMRLFRQPRFGDWQDVFDRVLEGLRCLSDARPRK